MRTQVWWNWSSDCVCVVGGVPSGAEAVSVTECHGLYWKRCTHLASAPTSLQASEKPSLDERVPQPLALPVVQSFQCPATGMAALSMPSESAVVPHNGC